MIINKKPQYFIVKLLYSVYLFGIVSNEILIKVNNLINTDQIRGHRFAKVCT